LGDTNCIVKSENDVVAFLKNRTRHIELELERYLFPEIFYGRKMVDSKSNIRQHESSPAESSLNCNKINLLVRFAGLHTEQHLHWDSIDFGLSVISVLECHETYSF
jgi:hypothetical protein